MVITAALKINKKNAQPMVLASIQCQGLYHLEYTVGLFEALF